jgi:RHS repeat-associated protein
LTESGLFLDRTYNHYWSGVGLFGKHWLSNLDYKLTFGTSQVNSCYPRPGGGTCGIGTNTVIWSLRPDGRRIKYVKNTSDGVFYEVKASAVSKIVKQADNSFILYGEDEEVEYYSSAGYISKVTDERGISWTSAYNGTYPTRVTHTNGRYIEFTWTNGELKAVRDPAGNYYGYAYHRDRFGAGLHLLAATSRPSEGLATTTYHYEDSRFPGALTGKSINNVRYSKFTYDANRYATSSEHGGQEKFTFVYTPAPNNVLNVVEINPLGYETRYKFVNGRLHTTEGQQSDFCPAMASSVIYDANGYEDKVTDFEGNVTDYTYNAKGQIQQKVEAYDDTSFKRTTDYVWETGRNRIQTETVVGHHSTTFAYTADNRPDYIDTKNLAPHGVADQIRKTDFTYTEHSNGLVASMVVDGPISGNADAETTSFSTAGDLQSVKNALQHATSYSNHNGLGQARHVVGVNGATSDLGYDGQGRLTSRTDYIGTTPYLTNWTYDERDLLVAVTTPDDHNRYFHYDLQRRLAAEFEREPSGSYAYRQYRYNNNSDVTVSQDYRLTSAPADPFPYDHHSASDSQIRGHIDGVFRHNDGRDYITGWACASAFNESIRVHVYLGGPAGPGDGVASVLANASGSDAAAIAAVCTGFGTNHRFRIPIADAWRAQHPGKAIYIHGISPYGTGNPTIAQSGVHHIPGGGGGGPDPEDPEPCPTDNCHVPITYPEGAGSMAVPVAGTTGDLHRQSFTDYDELGRVRASRGNDGQHLAYTYTLNGKVKTITDVSANPDRMTTYLYDPLDRVKQIIDAKNGNTYFKYDASDRIVEVKDPRGRITTYKYDGFGQLWSQTSPDTGTTAYAYTAGGQLESLTRNDGSPLTYGYDDSLARLRSIAGAGESRWFTYDACTHGKGQLCFAGTTVNGTNVTKVDLAYTPQGQLASRADKANGFVDTTSYEYDGMGRLTKLTYPSGIAANYAYSHGKVSSLTATIGSATHNMVTGIQYQPFGGATGWTYGNGMTRGQGYDLDGRLLTISSKNGSTVMQSLTYAWNANGLIEKVTNAADADQTHSYQYDELSRLTRDAYPGDSSVIVDSFDAVGNRTKRTRSDGGAVTSVIDYPIEATSNQMLAMTGGINRNFFYNARGHLDMSTGWLGTRTYAYDAFDRLKSTTVDGVTTSYLINALDQRVGKTGPLGTYRYVYAGQNMLLGEHKEDGGASLTGWTNYLYLHGQPVALVSINNNRYFLHTDHLGRPEVMTDGAKTPKWKAVNGSYNRTVTLGSGVHIGFPGQYWDEETDTWYNGFRDYDPYTGRYIQSDPIGLAGGVNTYAYVGGNPINFTDPLGLAGCAVVFSGYPITLPGTDTQLALGHAGVLTYDSSGSTRYYEYGRYNGDLGNVRRASVPDLKTGPDGKPTPESMSDLQKALTQNQGKGTQAKLKCDADADEKKIIAFAEQRMNDPNRAPYSWNPLSPNTCGTFVRDALRAGQK